jgi:hypothetical protein
LHSTFEAKELARQIERDDLPTPVTQNFAGANRAASDFVNALGRVMLLKNQRLGATSTLTPMPPTSKLNASVRYSGSVAALKD